MRDNGNRPQRYQVLARESAYRGFFRLDRLQVQHARFAGGSTPVLNREVFERGHSVGVLPYDPRRNAVVLIEQFRVGALEAAGGPWLMEVVAGIYGDQESAEIVARREMQEETGGMVTDLWPLYDYLVSPGGTSESSMLYLGRTDSTGLAGRLCGLPGEGEDIRVHVVAVAEALAMLADGRIRAAMPIIALQWLALNKARVDAAWQD